MNDNVVLPKHSEGLASEPLVTALLDEGDTSVGVVIFDEKSKKAPDTVRDLADLARD